VLNNQVPLLEYLLKILQRGLRIGMKTKAKLFYEFGAFRLDTTERLLLRGQEQIPLTPKLFETLFVFVQNAGHVLNKKELMEKV